MNQATAYTGYSAALDCETLTDGSKVWNIRLVVNGKTAITLSLASHNEAEAIEALEDIVHSINKHSLEQFEA